LDPKSTHEENRLDRQIPRGYILIYEILRIDVRHDVLCYLDGIGARGLCGSGAVSTGFAVVNDAG